MKTIIKLDAEIDLTKKPNEVRVKSVEGNPWNDFGYWLEVTGFMAFQAMKYREWTPEPMEQYVKEYVGKCLRDYKGKSV